MGFGQGLSGLNAASQSLDVIGNNIANAGTVGFKASSATFADVYASSRVGLGAQVASINQRFSVGTISNTGNQFDIAIDGAKGMFRLVDSSASVLYSRNGQFLTDKDGYIVNAQGHRLTGFPQGSTAPEPLRVPAGNIAPLATSAITSVINVDANTPPVPAGIAFSPENVESFTHSFPVNVYDSLGNAHQLTQYFVKRAGEEAPSGNWEVHYLLDGRALSNGQEGANPVQLVFDTAGRLVAPQDSVALVAPEVGGPSSSAQPLMLSIDYSGSTQFAGDFTYRFSQNGYATGEYASLSIAGDGAVVARYTNGQTQTVGALALADFANLQGLHPVGGNAWIETGESGQPVLGRPGANGMARLKGQAVEASNVDMSQELVSLIIAQRTYQANAQTIKTQDQVLQTLISMR